MEISTELGAQSIRNLQLEQGVSNFRAHQAAAMEFYTEQRTIRVEREKAEEKYTADRLEVESRANRKINLAICLTAVASFLLAVLVFLHAIDPSVIAKLKAHKIISEGSQPIYTANRSSTARADKESTWR